MVYDISPYYRGMQAFYTNDVNPHERGTPAHRDFANGYAAAMPNYDVEEKGRRLRSEQREDLP